MSTIKQLWVDFFAARFSIGPRLTWGQSDKGRIKTLNHGRRQAAKTWFQPQVTMMYFPFREKDTLSRLSSPFYPQKVPTCVCVFNVFLAVDVTIPTNSFHTFTSRIVCHKLLKHSRCWCLWHVPPVSRVKVPVQTSASWRRSKMLWPAYSAINWLALVSLGGAVSPHHAILKWAPVLLVLWGQGCTQGNYITSSMPPLCQSGLNGG